jgi:signal transduction histidine kinase
VILLMTGSSRAQECVTALEQQTVVANSVAKAAEVLQLDEFNVIVIDESWQQLDGGAENMVYSHAGIAVPIYVNLALHGTERVAEEVNCGLQRQVRERAAAMRAATSELSNHVRGEVTAILLNAELALREKALSASTAEKLTTIYEMADSMRRKLECHQAEAAKFTPKMKAVRRQAVAAVDR